FGNGVLELKNGQRWKPESNQKALLQELSSAKKIPILRRLFGR
ncbi:phage filamentation protein Fil family protein, partial [Yersinia enterocolitica]